MTPSLFLRDGKLFCTREEVPSKPTMAGERKWDETYASVIEQHNATISRLKAEAVEVSDPLKVDFIDMNIDLWQIDKKSMKEGEFYPIPEGYLVEVTIPSAPIARDEDEARDFENDYAVNGPDRNRKTVAIISKTAEPKKELCPCEEQRAKGNMVMCARCTGPVKKKEEESQDQLWADFWNKFRYAESKEGIEVAHKVVKHWFTITRKQ